jgi:hypothetical protein
VAPFAAALTGDAPFYGWHHLKPRRLDVVAAGFAFDWFRKSFAGFNPAMEELDDVAQAAST